MTWPGEYISSGVLVHVPGWRNWYTRVSDKYVPATACGFESRFGHTLALEIDSAPSAPYVLRYLSGTRRLRPIQQSPRAIWPAGFVLSAPQMAIGHQRGAQLCNSLLRNWPSHRSPVRQLGNRRLPNCPGLTTSCFLRGSPRRPTVSGMPIRRSSTAWSRNVLALQIDSGLHNRQGKAVTNFRATLPPAHSDLAQSITKDPYLFDFLVLCPPWRS